MDSYIERLMAAPGLRTARTTFCWQQWIIFRNERKFDGVYSVSDEGFRRKTLNLRKI